MKKERIIGLCLKAIRDQNLIRTGDSILAAVSGGRDSMVLLHVLLNLAPSLGSRVVAGHVDHGLRPDSSADADFVRRYCETLRVPFYLRTLSGEALKRADGGLEQAARDARLAALQAMAKEADAARIATGHHRDDQAQTVLYRALRGAGPIGLSGIRPVAGMFIRPMLTVPRAMIEDYAARHGIPYRDDSTNDDPRFVRNAIRMELLPVCEKLMPGSAASLARTAELSRLQTEAAAEWIEIDCAKTVAREVVGFSLLVDEMKKLGRPRRMMLIRRLIEDLPGVRIEMEVVRLIEKMILTAKPSAAANLGGGWVCKREYQRLVLAFSGAPRPVVEPGTMSIPGELILEGIGRLQAYVVSSGDKREPTPGPNVAYLQKCLAQSSLEVRCATKGDRYQPAGLDGRKKLSDLFVDAKIPARIRKCVPVVCDHDGIIWVAGFAPAARAAHPFDDAEALVLEFQPTNRTTE